MISLAYMLCQHLYTNSYFHQTQQTAAQTQAPSAAGPLLVCLEVGERSKVNAILLFIFESDLWSWAKAFNTVKLDLLIDKVMKINGFI